MFSIFPILSLTLVILKITHVLNWSWLLIMVPNFIMIFDILYNKLAEIK